MPSPFLLKALTTAPLKAAPIKSIFFSKLTDLGIKPLIGSNDACDNSKLLSKFTEAVTTLSNRVVYLYIVIITLIYYYCDIIKLLHMYSNRVLPQGLAQLPSPLNYLKWKGLLKLFPLYLSSYYFLTLR